MRGRRPPGGARSGQAWRLDPRTRLATGAHRAPACPRRATTRRGRQETPALRAPSRRSRRRRHRRAGSGRPHDSARGRARSTASRAEEAARSWCAPTRGPTTAPGSATTAPGSAGHPPPRNRPPRGDTPSMGGAWTGWRDTGPAPRTSRATASSAASWLASTARSPMPRGSRRNRTSRRRHAGRPLSSGARGHRARCAGRAVRAREPGHTHPRAGFDRTPLLGRPPPSAPPSITWGRNASRTSSAPSPAAVARALSAHGSTAGTRAPRSHHHRR